MRRIITSTALVFAGALLLSGCSTGGGTPTPTPSADSCAEIQSEITDISNGAQNTLASGDDPAEIHSSLEDYSDRAAELAKTTDDDAVTKELDALSSALDEAAAYSSTLPSDPEAEADADALAAQQTAISDAAKAAGDACKAE